MSIDWGAVWAFVWPILQQALIALLVSILALLGYDARILPARLLRALTAMGFKVDHEKHEKHESAKR